MGDKPIKVLLVEDNLGDARLIREFLLEAIGESFDLKIANKLFDGIKLLLASTFDVVLLDLSLPDSTGLDTLTKTNTSAPQVPIIVLTGLDDDTLAVEAVRGGAQDYLVKGQINAELLCRTIHYSIERKQAEEVIAERYSREGYKDAAKLAIVTGVAIIAKALNPEMPIETEILASAPIAYYSLKNIASGLGSYLSAKAR